MKTAKEIIEALIFPDEIVIDTLGEDIQFVSANDAISAMESYASERLREELIKFYLWVDENYAMGMLTDKTDLVIDNYLNTKNRTELKSKQ